MASKLLTDDRNGLVRVNAANDGNSRFHFSYPEISHGYGFGWPVYGRLLIDSRSSDSTGVHPLGDILCLAVFATIAGAQRAKALIALQQHISLACNGKYSTGTPRVRHPANY